MNARADNTGFTPLHRASANGALENVRLMLEHGADVEAVDADGKTSEQIRLGECGSGTT